jgi:hypothetical protein
MEDIEEILEEQNLSKDNLEASLELAKLVAQETGLCCEELGRFVWSCYQKLEGEESKQ